MFVRQISSRQRGVILLEFLIAFSLLAISVSVLNSVGAGAFRNLRTASDQLRAAQLASDLLVEFSLSATSNTTRRRGVYQDRFRWVVAATPSPGPGVAHALVTAELSRLRVDIEWGDSGRPRRYSLDALRLLRAPPATNGAG